MRILPVSLLLSSLLSVAPVFAGTPINETRPLDPRGHVEVDNLKGSIKVRAWDRPEVRITGTLGEGVEKLLVEGDARHLSIKVKYPKHAGGIGWGDINKAGPTDLELMVPVLADLEVDAVSASVDVSGVASSILSVDSVSGRVVVAAAPRRADINSVSGDLDLTLNSAAASVETVSGDIELDGRLDGELHAETVSGNVHVDTRGERLKRLSFSTVSGDADVRMGLATRGVAKMESVSGDMVLRLPEGVSADIHGESFSGSLSAPGARIDRPKYGPGSSFEARYGEGAGEVRLETFSGDVRVVVD